MTAAECNHDDGDGAIWPPSQPQLHHSSVPSHGPNCGPLLGSASLLLLRFELVGKRIGWHENERRLKGLFHQASHAPGDNGLLLEAVTRV
jgi:hypothetical protein